MKKQTLFLTFTFAALVFGVLLSGCSKPATTYDESAYLGTYYGKHYLADSNTIRGLTDPTANMIYDDTLVVTNGSSTTDGKVIAKSNLLNGGNIEIDITSGEITPVDLGNVDILGTTLKYTKLKTGSTGNWNTDKSVVTTHLVASVTYDFNGTDIPLYPVNINGVFNKQ